MKNYMVKNLNEMFEKLNIDYDEREELLTYLIRKAVLEKYEIDCDSYINFLFQFFGKTDKNLKENPFQKKIGEAGLSNLDILSICGILDEYLSHEKREVTGSYYTPTYVVKYMISNSLKAYIEENTKIDTSYVDRLIDHGTICNIGDEQLFDLLNILINLKIIDISCGSGLFLYYFFQKIYSIKIQIYNKLECEYDEYYEKKWILENNIFGIDIQRAPLEMITLKFIDILAKYKDFNLSSLNFNLYKKDSVLGDEIFKASKVKEVVDEGGFDIVIGNPPYIGEKGNKDLFGNIKKYEFGKKYYEAKMDYFYYFIYRGIDILKAKGILSYITTNYFITADGAKGLRKILKERVSFKTIINFNELEIFKAAKGQHNMIFTLTKGRIKDKHIEIKYMKKSDLKINKIIDIINNKEVNNDNVSSYILENQSKLYDGNGNIMIFPQKEYSQILRKIRLCSELTLGDICNINQGIVSGADKVTKRIIERKLKKEYVEKNNIKINKGIFVLNQEEIIDLNIQSCRLLKPFYKNSNIKKYYTKSFTNKYILYFTDNNIQCSDYCFIIQKHLKKFKDVLIQRRETKKGTRNWFALQWSREQSIFEGAKIVVPQRALQNNFGYNEDMWYASADVYFITAKQKNIDLKLLLSILNSKIMYFWLYNMGKRKGDYLELYSTPLAQIPINLQLDNNIKEEIVRTVNKILSCCKDNYNYELVEECQNRIDNMLYRVFDFHKEEIKAIEKLYVDKHYK